MPDLREDFVKEEIIDLDVGGRIFKYKPVTAGQENDWTDEYTDYVDDGQGGKKPKVSLSKFNKLRMQNLVEVPYGKDIIKALIGKDKEWKELNHDEQWALLGKLKGSVLNDIIRAMDDYDKGGGATKKA